MDKAAQETPLIGALIPHLNLTEFTPHYTGPDKESAMSRGLLTLTLAVMEKRCPWHDPAPQSSGIPSPETSA